MSAGDILFYRDHGTLFDALIVRGTHGPFVHCEIDLGDGTSIGALGRGVTHHPRPAPAAVAAVGPLLAQRDPQRFAAALAWLGKRVGARYGVGDIAADVLKALLPARLGSRTPFLVMPSQFDCSHLAAAFLVLAGADLPPEIVTDLPRTSPNDLARALGMDMGMGAGTMAGSSAAA